MSIVPKARDERWEIETGKKERREEKRGEESRPELGREKEKSAKRNGIFAK